MADNEINGCLRRKGMWKKYLKTNKIEEQNNAR